MRGNVGVVVARLLMKAGDRGSNPLQSAGLSCDKQKPKNFFMAACSVTVARPQHGFVDGSTPSFCGQNDVGRLVQFQRQPKIYVDVF